MKRLRIALAAEESAGARALRLVEDTDHELVCVLTSGGESGAASALAKAARERGHRVEPASRVRSAELGVELRDRQVDLLVNVHSLFVADEAVVRAPRIGSFNLHPGSLPEYAGLNTPCWAVYKRESHYGPTLHWMEPGIDTGSIAYSDRFPLTDDDTGLSVSTRCIRDGLPLVARLLEDAACGVIPRHPQDLSRRVFYRRADVPHRGRVSWSFPAREIDALVRASDFHPFPSPWGHPRAVLDGARIGLVKVGLTAETSDAPAGTVRVGPGGVTVATQDEWLAVKAVQLGGSYVDPSDVLAGG